MTTTYESNYVQEGKSQDYTAVADHTGGQVVQLPDGRAGISPCDIAAGKLGAMRVCGHFDVLKAASVVIIDGAPLWWDHSANGATPVPPLVAGDRDFYIGTAVGDVAASATTCRVDLNNQPVYEIDFHRDGGDTAIVAAAGAPTIYSRGGSLVAAFGVTAEAQKLDWLSKRSFAKGAKWILEAVVEVVGNCDADVGDLNVGVANGTHASDADSITESAFFHFDMGADLNLDAKSVDGTTTVNATDTTIDWAEGTPIHLVIDGRDLTDIQMYVNGILVLGSTAFKLDAATGPLKALFHLEKSSNDSLGTVQLDMLRVRTSEQG
jgi:predicted RecA/RadA family phage recombinase